MSLFIPLILAISLSPDTNDTVYSRLISDVSVFRYSDSLSYVEVYYMLNTNLLFQEVDTPKTELSYTVRVKVSDEKGRKKDITERWEKTVRKMAGRFIVDRFELILIPGRYTLTLDIENKDRIIGRAIHSLETPRWNDELMLSDIELVWNIQRDTTQSIFNRYGLKVIPNPQGAYSQDKDTLFYLFEIYNIPRDSGDLLIHGGIYNSEGKLVRLLGREIDKKTQTKIVKTGGVRLEGLPEGKYSLLIEVVDLSKGERTKKRKEFYYRAPSIISEMDEDILSFIDYYATPQELKEFKSIEDKRGRILFLKKFWKKMDPAPETQVNEFLIHFKERVLYADENFTNSFEQGRYTDMGRIYIKYGPPEEIKKKSLEEGKDREHWYYYSKGGMQFAFVDIRGTGVYKLVYSSIKEEPTYPDWYRYIPSSEVEKTGW